jgi:hypothetical protein
VVTKSRFERDVIEESCLSKTCYTKTNPNSCDVGMPSPQLYAGDSNFEPISPDVRSGQSWGKKTFPFGQSFRFQAKDEKFLKMILWYHLWKIFSSFDSIKGWLPYHNSCNAARIPIYLLRGNTHRSEKVLFFQSFLW